MPPGNSNAKPESTSAYRGRKLEVRPTDQLRSSVPTIQSGPHRTNVPSRVLVASNLIEQYDENHGTVNRNTNSGNVCWGPLPSEANTTASDNAATHSHVESVVQAGPSNTSKKTISSPSTLKAPPNSISTAQSSGNAHQDINEPTSVSKTDISTIGVTASGTSAASCDNFTSANHSCQSGAIPKRNALKNDGNDKVTFSFLHESNSSSSNVRETTPDKPLDSSIQVRESALETVPFELMKIQKPHSKCIQSFKDAETSGTNACNTSSDKKLRNFDGSISSASEVKDFSGERASVEKSSGKKFEKNSDFVFVKSVVSEFPAKKQRSHNAVTYEGVVEQILDLKTARIKVAEKNGKPIPKSQWGSADAVHMFAQLIVTKLRPNKLELFYPTGMSMKSVLEKGEIVQLICTPHKTPKIGFDLFAHEAWKIPEKKPKNSPMERIGDNYTFPVRDSMDTESVASTCSGSDTKWSNSSRSRSRRNRKKVNEEKFAECIWDWLDINANSDSNQIYSDWSGPDGVTLLEGGLYVGMVSELRLPFAFVVKISTVGGNQWVFVFSTHFHPQGPNSPCLERGISLRSLVNVGNEIALIPTRNESKEKGKFSWVAKSAWPANSVTTESGDGKLGRNAWQHIGDNCESGQLQQSVHPLNLGCSLATKTWKEISGVILTLDFDWGLVKEQVGGGSAYVFHRKNMFLFGLCLEDMVMHEVFQEGQLVKFYLEKEDAGEMNVCELHSGDSLPDLNSFEKAVFQYCQERRLKISVEKSLMHSGQKKYLQK